MAQIGLKDIYYALLTSDAAGAAVYAEPVRISGAISANVNPNFASGTLFADDGPYDTATTMGEIEVEIGIADLPLKVQAIVLGHTFDITKGILSKSGNDIPPWLALGFRSLKSDGKYRYFWLVKGKFTPGEEEFGTKGDSVEFKTPTVKFSGAKREADDKWQLVADTADTEFTGAANWYKAATLAVVTP